MDARLRGQADFRNGKRLEHNPYRSIKEGKRAWIRGWHEARELSPPVPNKGGR
jgi:ribosome modulation factor